MNGQGDTEVRSDRAGYACMEGGYTGDDARVYFAARWPVAACRWCEEPQMAATPPRASNFAPYTTPMMSVGGLT
jgi:hypothetical protein